LHSYPVDHCKIHRQKCSADGFVQKTKEREDGHLQIFRSDEKGEKIEGGSKEGEEKMERRVGRGRGVGEKYMEYTATPQQIIFRKQSKKNTASFTTIMKFPILSSSYSYSLHCHSPSFEIASLELEVLCVAKARTGELLQTHFPREKNVTKKMSYVHVQYRLELIYTWQCGGLAYPTREMQGSALRRSIAGCCKKFPQATLRAAGR